MGFQRRVALKLLRSDAVDIAGQFVTAMAREARIGGLLQHPNVAAVVEFDHVKGQYFLAMEFVEGHTLEEIIKVARGRGVQVPAGITLRAIRQVCRGLDYVHRATNRAGEPLNVIHRDIKPSNIMVDRYGTAKILDFGIARADASMFTLTSSELIKGTLYYLAPEQIETPSKLTYRVDLYALGVVLYELVTCELLFEAPTIPALLRMVTDAPVSRQVAHAERCLPGIGSVLDRLLQKNPAMRIPSASALAEELRGVDERHSVSDDLERLVISFMAMPNETMDLPTNTTFIRVDGVEKPRASSPPAQPAASPLPPRVPPASTWAPSTEVGPTLAPAVPDSQLRAKEVDPFPLATSEQAPRIEPDLRDERRSRGRGRILGAGVAAALVLVLATVLAAGFLWRIRSVFQEPRVEPTIGLAELLVDDESVDGADGQMPPGTERPGASIDETRNAGSEEQPSLDEGSPGPDEQRSESAPNSVLGSPEEPVLTVVTLAPSPAARIGLDGRMLEGEAAKRNPMEIAVPVGIHTITLTADGYDPVTFELTADGDSQRIDWSFDASGKRMYTKGLALIK